MKTQQFNPAVTLLTLCLLAALPADATDVTWTNLAGGNWNVAANWSPNQVPGTNDNAYITNNGTYTVTFNTNATNVSLTLGGSSGVQTLTNASFTLTLDSPSTVKSNGVFALGGGTLNGAGALAINGTLRWNGGTLSGTGGTSVGSGGTLTMGGGTKALSGVLLINAGQITWSGGQLNTGGNAVLSNLVGATFDITGDGAASLTANGVFTIYNAGLFRKSAGSGTSIARGVFYNSGLVEAHSGTLDLAYGGTHTGSFTAGPGATLAFGNLSNGGGSYTHELTTNSSVTGSGNVRFGTGAGTGGANSGVVNVNGTYNVTGSNIFDGGTANFQGNYTLTNQEVSVPLSVVNFNAGGTLGLTALTVSGGAVAFNQALPRVANVTLTAGTIAGTVPITVTNSMIWTSGILGGTNSLNISTGATLQASGTGIKYLNRVLNNAGTVIWNGVGNYAGGGGGTINNLAGGLFEVQSDQTFYNLYVKNAGTFRKSGGTGTTAFSQYLASGYSFTNSGTVEVQSGILSEQERYTQTPTGTLKVTLGGPTPATNYGVLQAGTATLDGLVDVRLTNGYLPGLTNRFQVLTCGTRNGTFASFSADPLGSTNYLNVAYSPTAVEIFVTNAIPWFTKLQALQPSHLFQIQIAGVAGQRYAVEATTNFASWTPVTTNFVPGSALLTWIDPESTSYRYRFYRARFVP